MEPNPGCSDTRDPNPAALYKGTTDAELVEDSDVCLVKWRAVHFDGKEDAETFKEYLLVEYRHVCFGRWH